MPRQTPPLRFVRKHKGSLDYLPLHLQRDGEVSEQMYLPTCACGWRGTETASQMVATSQQADHVWSRWRQVSEEGEDNSRAHMPK